jgi:hypothetical protein
MTVVCGRLNPSESPARQGVNAGLCKMPISYDYLRNINRLLINFLATHWLYPP